MLQQKARAAAALPGNTLQRRTVHAGLAARLAAHHTALVGCWVLL